MLVLLNWHPAIGVLLPLVFTIVASAPLLRFWEVQGPMHTGMHNGILANVGFVGGLLLLQHVLRPGPKRGEERIAIAGAAQQRGRP